MTVRSAIVMSFAAGLVVSCSTGERGAGVIDVSPGGRTEWVDTTHGRLKTEVFATENLSAAPILIVVLHGDIPNPPPSYQYYFAQAVAEGYDAVTVMPPQVRETLGEPLDLEDVVAAGVLRPGYVDAEGDRSDGDMGAAWGDNYTPEVVDAVAEVIERLKAEYGASAVVLAGHSGGASIAADLIGRHPGLVDGALLVACGCDPEGWRALMSETNPDPALKGPTRSLQPLDLAPHVPIGARVRMVVGDADDVVPPDYTLAYAAALEARGVDVEVSVEHGLGHNMMFTAPVFTKLAQLVGEVTAAR